MSITANYLLRVRLPDRPGVLGQVATALGSTGADIDSIIVVDRTEGYAVDDLVVALPAGGLADRLVSAATSVPGVFVETVQRHHGRRRIHDDLSLLDAAASDDHPLATLVEGLPALMQISYALVVSVATNGVGRLEAASSGAPTEGLRGGWIPVDAPGPIIASSIWDDPASAGPDVVLVGVPFGPATALVAGRIGGPDFLPAEMLRLGHLARVAQALLPVTYR
jgi:hypothetical protein